MALVAVLGKFLAGYAAVRWVVKKKVIGMGMVPHGEIGLLFANIALASQAFDRAVFSAVAVAVFVTTYVGLLGLQVMFRMVPERTERAKPAPEASASPG